MTLTPPLSGMSRNTAIVVSVLCFHVMMLWALQSGLLRRTVDVFVPVEMLSEFIEPPAPKETPQPPKPPEQVVQPMVKIKAPTPPPPPQLMAIADPTPSVNAPVGMVTPQPPAPPIIAPVAVVPEPAPAPATPPPAPPRVELPSTDADYLQNPRPVYPPMSKRLGEQGQVIHSVLIGVDGLPISAKLVKSSGFDRLDAAAYAAVMSWRYVPGKRNGAAAQMSYNAPINWVLE
jgi:periplasmic protein TonB